MAKTFLIILIVIIYPLLAAARESPAAEPRFLVNHLGYDSRLPKSAVIAAAEQPMLDTFILAADDGKVVFQGKVQPAETVTGWKGRHFCIVDFSEFTLEGNFRLGLPLASGTIWSEPFAIRSNLLPDLCLSDILFYFKGRRCSGDFDRADRQIPFFGGRRDRVDVHGGWFDASGDLSKYLTHLSYAGFMNPQQAPQVVWNLLAAYDLLRGTKSERMQCLLPLMVDEARHGVDFLVRMQDPAGYFYTSVFDVWTHDPSQRMISSFKMQTGDRDDRYRAGYRMGAGMAIAALARASALGGGGEYSASRYLQAAKKGFHHLEKHNREYLNDGRENIIDDYCGLLAATELFAVDNDPAFLRIARQRAGSLIGRLSSDENYRGWWRADDTGERPYYHAVEAGLPVVALLRYMQVEPGKDRKKETEKAVIASLQFELAITKETCNPFGLARQYVKETGGKKKTAFFMPHRNESGYWWQGENARLGSLAAAALLASTIAGNDLKKELLRYAVDQVDWILGLNPFDICMLQGRGRNNPDYLPGFPNAPGGICNGITAGFEDENDIAFLPPPWNDDPSHNWRWSEQWLPHDAWMLLALASMGSVVQ